MVAPVSYFCMYLHSGYGGVKTRLFVYLIHSGLNTGFTCLILAWLSCPFTQHTVTLRFFLLSAKVLHTITLLQWFQCNSSRSRWRLIELNGECDRCGAPRGVLILGHISEVSRKAQEPSSPIYSTALVVRSTVASFMQMKNDMFTCLLGFTDAYSVNRH